MITNAEITRTTGQQTMGEIIRQRRMHWPGPVHRMENNQIPKQEVDWLQQQKKRQTYDNVEENCRTRPATHGICRGLAVDRIRLETVE